MTTNDAVINAAVSGFVITRILSYQVAEEIESGALCAVLTDFECHPLPIHIVHQQGANVTNKVRAFIDLASAQLRADKRLNYCMDWCNCWNWILLLSSSWQRLSISSTK